MYGERTKGRVMLSLDSNCDKKFLPQLSNDVQQIYPFQLELNGGFKQPYDFPKK